MVEHGLIQGIRDKGCVFILKYYFSWKNNIKITRPIHESGRIGFGLNPHLTRPDQMDRLSTCRRPGGWSVRTGWNINERQSGSVRVEIWKIEEIWRKNYENRPKSFEISSEISKILTRFGKISLDLAKNLARSSEISSNLAKEHLKTRWTMKKGQNPLRFRQK